MDTLDIDFVRSHFPCAMEDDKQGHAFFENAGGSYMPDQVISRLQRFHSQRRVQPYWPFKSSELAGEEMDEARRRMSALLKIPPETLHFGASTSQNTYVLASAFGSVHSERKIILVTNQDHEANSGVWRRLARRGFQIREWKVQKDTGLLLLDDLKKLINEDVFLVTFPHCSNIIGEINPVKEICTLAKSYGALTCVDGVSYVPHTFPDVIDLGADIYLFSTYKTYGPHLGLMYVDAELNKRLPCQGHFFNDHDLTKTLSPSGPDHAQIAAVAGIVDYVEDLARHHFGENSFRDLGDLAKRVGVLQRNTESTLLKPLLELLQSKKAVRVLCSSTINLEQKVPTVSLKVNGNTKNIVIKLASKGLMAGFGDFYSVRLLEALGLELPNGVLRLSFVHYTKAEDVSSLVKALDEIL